MLKNVLARISQIKILPPNISWFEIIFTAIAPIGSIIVGCRLIAKKIEDKISPHKEIKNLLEQVNAYYKNIYGKSTYRKNGTVHIRFMNRESPRKNKKISNAYIDIIKTTKGSYRILHHSFSHDDMYIFSEFEGYKNKMDAGEEGFRFGDESIFDISLDDLRTIFQHLNSKQNRFDFREIVEKFVKIAQRKKFIKDYFWKYEDTEKANTLDVLSKYSLPEYCFIERDNYCYILSLGTDSKINIRVSSITNYQKIKVGYDNIGQYLGDAVMIVNMPPEWMPRFVSKHITYYPWGCNVRDIFRAVKFWENKQCYQYEEHDLANGRGMKLYEKPRYRK
jgi:hypothetical protein